jgi:hypothetical protein
VFTAVFVTQAQTWPLRSSRKTLCHGSQHAMQAGLLQGGRMVRATMLGAPPLGLRVWSLFLAAISLCLSPSYEAWILTAPYNRQSHRSAKSRGESK